MIGLSRELLVDMVLFQAAYAVAAAAIIVPLLWYARRKQARSRTLRSDGA